MPAAAEKEVLPPALAQRKATPPREAKSEVTSSEVKSDAADKPAEVKDPVAEVAPKKTWKFVKNYGVGDVIKFKDGTSFSFRQIVRNNDYGIQSNSFVITEDETLANNLREAAKNPYTAIVEVNQ